MEGHLWLILWIILIFTDSYYVKKKQNKKKVKKGRKSEKTWRKQPLQNYSIYFSIIIMLIKNYVSNGRPLMIDTMNNSYINWFILCLKNPKKVKIRKKVKKNPEKGKKPEKTRKSPVKAGFFQVGFFGFFRVGFFGLGFLIPTLLLWI